MVYILIFYKNLASAKKVFIFIKIKIMKVQVQETEFSVKFYHQNQPESGVFTDCRIEVGDKTLGKGRAILAKGDSFVKDMGRKISLKRALQNANIVDRKIRKNFWDNYHILTNKKERIKKLEKSK